MRLSIGELLLKQSLITSQQLLEALDHQARHGGSLSQALVTLGFANDRDYGSPGPTTQRGAERGLRLVWSGERTRGGTGDTEGDGPSAA